MGGRSIIELLLIYATQHDLELNDAAELGYD